MGETIFDKPKIMEVVLGGHPYKLSEIRPTDLIAVRNFVAKFSENKEDVYKNIEATSILNIIPQKVIELWGTKPEDICQLLAEVLNPNPGDIESDWVEKKSKEFYQLPISELNKAIEAWMKLNAFFLAEMMTPLINGITYVILQQAENVLGALATQNKILSDTGNA
jgi:hypothetical protein